MSQETFADPTVKGLLDRCIFEKIDADERAAKYQEIVDEAIATLEDRIDARAATAVWEAALGATASVPRVWVHGDLAVHQAAQPRHGAEGRPGNRHVLFQDPKQSRQFIDLEWDPEANVDNLLLWVDVQLRTDLPAAFRADRPELLDVNPPTPHSDAIFRDTKAVHQ